MLDQGTGWARLSASGELLDLDGTAAFIAGYASVEEARARAEHLWPVERAREWVRSEGARSTPRSFEQPGRAPDGTDRCARVLVVPARDPTCPERCFDVYIEPLTDAEQAEHADLLLQVLEALPNPVFVKDAQHRWVVINDALCRFMGHDRAELLGKSDYDFFPKSEADVFWRKDDAVFATGELNENEERLTDASGRTHVILTRKTLHVDPMGRRFLIGVITDVTERTRIREELRSRRDELDRRVQERTAELQRLNAQLQEEDRRKNEFIAVLSHELRNPLAPVRNALFILAHVEPRSSKATGARAVLGRQIDHLAALLDDLLDITRISRGKIELRREPLELTRVVEDSVEDHRALFAARGVDIELQIPHEAPVVDADPTRLAQIVGNLLQNAAKFTNRGGRVQVAVEQPSGGMVAVRVHDTGVGIEPRLLERLFQPFTQGDESLDRTRGGLGLGLSLVKALTDLHGGTVEAHSEGPGRGAEFIVRLPAAARVARPATPPLTAARSARRRILVIEDNAEAAETLRVALQLDDHEVEVARDGREGLAMARAFRPDLVLCDLGLPLMDGYAVARAIRTDPVLRDTELVAVSGYALPEDRRKAAEAGFDRHLPKPVPLEQLEELLASGVRGEEDAAPTPFAPAGSQRGGGAEASRHGT
jgi:two-component system CheB/CheR fusion protein